MGNKSNSNIAFTSAKLSLALYALSTFSHIDLFISRIPFGMVGYTLNKSSK